MNPALFARDNHVTLRVLEGEKTLMLALDLRLSSAAVDLIVHRTVERVFGDVVPAGTVKRIKWLRRNNERFIPRLRQLTGE